MPPFDLYGRSTIPGEFIEVDMNAQYILDKCRLKFLGAPANTTGDGNCLFNAVSIALTGYEKPSGELRMRMAVEMASNSAVYTSRDDFNELMDHSPSFEESLKTLKHTAVFEYRGEQPSSTNYVRTNPKTVDKIKTQVKTKPPKEVHLAKFLTLPVVFSIYISEMTA